MITAENQPVCPDIKSRLTGYNSMYDITEDTDIDEGVILCAYLDETYMFQNKEKINILSTSHVGYIDGSELTYLDDVKSELPFSYFSISSVRFPTKEELEWYNKQDTI